VRYISTRGEAPALGFEDVLLTGLATDGGLYVPESLPHFDLEEIRSWRGLSYSELAFNVMYPFVDDAIPADDFRKMLDETYSVFAHKAVAPLVQLDTNEWVMELFRGPTLAFKDFALQLLGRLLDYVLEKRKQHVVIMGATSGDTGSAAIEGCRRCEHVDIFILHPYQRVSEVQRRQMTTVQGENIHNIAVRGNFDDCQRMVKESFGNQSFLGGKTQLAAVNSINWARIMAQIVYYFTSAVSLGAPDRKVSFTVPTGNFGDIFAGYCAKRMGLPIAKLVIATNENDILARTMRTGRYEMRGVSPTTSPSMDIQISSNFERLLFDANDRDAEAVRRAMSGLKQSGAFDIAEPALKAIRKEFRAGRASERQVKAIIREVQAGTGYVLDPHTAVAVHVAARMEKPSAPMITLATAHPAKFPDAVKNACGIDPALPSWLSDLMQREERFNVVPNDQNAVESHIRSLTRAAR